MSNNELWYDSPAAEWNAALPVGNGRLGAMVFGRIEHERIQLNEDSVWYGGPMDRINPSALPNLEKVRALIREERIPEAERLLKVAFSGIPQSMRPYQSLGDLFLDFPEKGTVTEYRRSLSVSDSYAEVTYVSGGVRYSRKLIASFPQQVLALRITADKPGSVSLTCHLERGRFLDSTGALADDAVMLRGNGGEGGVRFCSAVKASAKGGTVAVYGEHLVVEGADEATLYISAETSYYHGDRYMDVIRERLESAAAKGFSAIDEEHQEDYHRLYGQIRLSLCPEGSPLSTDKRLENPDLGLIELYFNFGRYLLISSSRPGSLPANLQGIWNESMSPKWDSKYTININTEMNYWPAECCGLSECHLPLFDLLKRMQPEGRKVARQMYNCRGSVTHHNTDLWGDSAPQDFWMPGTYWVLGGAWLCTHIWTHYEYTEDKAFLSSMFPVMEDNVLFLEDFLIEEDGCLVLSPSASPENTYIMDDGTKGSVCSGPAMDGEILRDLFSDYLKAASALGVENEVTQKAKEMIPRFTPIKIGKHGQIMEWRKDWDEAEPGHRHISQLYALFPGSEITPEHTPELAKAAEVTLHRRLSHGGAYTGWSCAWVICFYAALGRGKEAEECIYKLFRNSTCINLFDNHPLNPSGHIFQIDGNLGTVAGIVRMLVKMDGEEIVLLPALPESWEKGSLSGVRLPHGLVLSFHWDEDGAYVDDLKARHPGVYRIRHGRSIQNADCSSGCPVSGLKFTNSD